MEIKPILSALSRNKVGAALIALQIALTLAVVTNSIFIIRERAERIARPSGLDEANTIYAMTTDFARSIDSRQLLQDDLAALNAMPGVRAAIATHSLPISGSGNGQTYSPAADTPSNEAIQFGNFSGDHRALEAYDLELVAGRGFRPEEVYDRTLHTQGSPRVVLVSQALANELFPGEPAVGKLIWQDDDGRTSAEIIGVYDHMMHAWPNSGFDDRSSIQPFRDISTPDRAFIIRTEPGQRDEIMQAVETYFSQQPGRMIQMVRSLEEQKRRTYSEDIAMVRLLSGVAAILTLVTALGIVGMAWFSVSQRRRQIGTRRALGATRLDIMRYFMLENWLITSVGLLLGVAAALGLNWFLDTEYQSGRMPLLYLPLGVVAMWVLGQLAVLAPARRAASIPPALATRSA